jgi:hypothetical protein
MLRYFRIFKRIGESLRVFSMSFLSSPPALLSSCKICTGLYLTRRDLLACTTWFHQSQVYQPIYTKLSYTELIFTKPHFYHPPNMVAHTRESSPSRPTRAQGRPLMICAFGKNHSASFLLFTDPRVNSRCGTDELW